jgi:hypothetical protein
LRSGKVALDVHQAFQLGGSPRSISIFPNALLSRAPVANAHGTMRFKPSAKDVSTDFPKTLRVLLWSLKANATSFRASRWIMEPSFPIACITKVASS